METAFVPNRLVVSQGDPDGVGPDLILRAAAQGRFEEGDEIVACPRVLRDRAHLLDQAWSLQGWARVEPLLVRDSGMGSGQFPILEDAVTRVLAAKGAAALVTAPIDKAVAAQEGLPTPGHTEYLALRAASKEVAMLMAGPRLRVALATVHLALREVPDALDAECIERRAGLLVSALRAVYGIRTPRIALLGLNPHAGEGGRFGTEERDLIEGCVQRLSRELEGQAQIFGPLPADTAFYQHGQGHYDGLLAMYHDQGLAPFKLMHFHSGVNVTLGLPFLRTSPDHGTAKDLAGSLKVDARSFFSSITLARGRREEIEAWIQDSDG